MPPLYRLPLHLCLALWLGLFGLGLAPAPQSAGVIAESDFWELVERTHAAALEAQQQPGMENYPPFVRLAAEWQAVVQVERSDQTLVSVETNWMSDLLLLIPPQPTAVEEAASLLLNGRQLPQRQWLLDPTVGLENILQRPEFQWEQEAQQNAWWANFWQRFWDAVFDWLDRLLGGRDFSVSAPVIGSIQWLALGLGLLLIGLLLGFAIRHLRRSFAPASDLPAHGPDGEKISASAALQSADQFSSQGDYRKAVRFLYLSALLTLDEAGLLRYDRTRTNHEYLRSLRSQPEILTLLSDVVEVFDRVWYGYQTISPDDYAHYSGQIAELQRRRQRMAP